MVLIMLGLLPLAKVFRLLPALLAGPPGLQLLDGICQSRIVVVAVLELKLLRSSISERSHAQMNCSAAIPW